MKWIVWNHDLSGGEAYEIEAPSEGEAAIIALDNMNRTVFLKSEEDEEN